MTAEEKAAKLGIEFPDDAKPGYLNMAVRTGNLIITSGHVSKMMGKLGDDLSVEQGYEAARQAVVWILQTIHQMQGSLEGVKVLKLLGMVNSTPDFIDHHLVINGASDLLHEIFGKEGDGYHARSAVGFAALPTGVAVEIEAIFELS